VSPTTRDCGAGDFVANVFASERAFESAIFDSLDPQFPPASAEPTIFLAPDWLNCLRAEMSQQRSFRPVRNEALSQAQRNAAPPCGFQLVSKGVEFRASFPLTRMASVNLMTRGGRHDLVHSPLQPRRA